MNTLWKIVFWSMTIALGFVNPLISFGLVLLYYLPEITSSICKQCSEQNEEIILENFENKPNSSKLNHYSNDTLEKMK